MNLSQIKLEVIVLIFFFGVKLSFLTVQIPVVRIITAIFNTKCVHFVHTEYSFVPFDVYKKHLLCIYTFLTNWFFVRIAHSILSEITIKAVYTPA